MVIKTGVVSRERSEFDRGLSFFDAIYGFAITLLIANIDLPPAQAWRSVTALFSGGFGAQLLGFLISFVVIAIFWKTNYDMLGQFSGMNSAVIIANIAATGMVVFIPFTTQAISDPAIAELPLAVVLYALNIVVAILMQLVVFEVGFRQGLLENLRPSARWVRWVNVASSMGVFLLSIPVAYLIGPTWAMLCWALLLIVDPVIGRWSLRKSEQGDDNTDAAT